MKTCDSRYKVGVSGPIVTCGKFVKHSGFHLGEFALLSRRVQIVWTDVTQLLDDAREGFK